MEFILLSEVLDVMHKTKKKGEELKPFSITFITYSFFKKEGGDRRTISNAVLLKNAKGANKALKHYKVDPNHYSNFTRNIYDLETNKIIKIRPRLIIKFNGKNVVYG